MTSKLVQASSTSIVRQLYGREGELVPRDESLVDLYPTLSTAEEALLPAEIESR